MYPRRIDRSFQKDNPEFYKELDKLIVRIMKEKIKNITLGFHYNYITIHGGFAVETGDQDQEGYLILRQGNLMRLELHFNGWNTIEEKSRNVVHVGGSQYGITFEFERKKSAKNTNRTEGSKS